MSIEIITATLAAGVPQVFHLNGEYFEVLDAQYSLDVSLVSRTGSPLSTLKNAEASFFTRPGHFGTVILTSVQAQVVRFMFGEGDVGTRRISSTVQVVDGGKARTLANAAFAQAGASAAVAAQFSQGQWMNPAGSGVRVVVKSFTVSAAAATSIAVGPYATPLATLGAGAPSKLAGGAPSVSVSRTGSSGVGIVAAYWDFVILPAAGSVTRTLAEPIVLNPGQSIVMENKTVNQVLNFTIEFIEEVV